MAVVGPSVQPWPAGPQLPGFYIYNITHFDKDGFFESLNPQVFGQLVRYNFDGSRHVTVRMIKNQYTASLMCNGKKKDVITDAKVSGLSPGSVVKADYDYGNRSGFMGYLVELRYYDGNTPKTYRGSIGPGPNRGASIPSTVTVDGQTFPVRSASITARAIMFGMPNCSNRFTSLRVAPGR
jgi:hypothetical protein